MIPHSKHSGYQLITGGTGFIGQAVARRLASRGTNVVVTGRNPPPALSGSDLAGRIEYRTFELSDAAWDDLVEGASIIHHYAWTSLPATADADPARDLNDNVVPTIRMLDAVRRRGVNAPRVIFASSGGTVYGQPRQIPVPESHPLEPLTAYGVGKATAEMYANQYRALYGLDCRIARIANPFGAGQNAGRGQGAVTIFIRKALARLPIEIWGNGEVTRDYVHISDVADGLIAMAEADLPAGSSTLNIGSGVGVSLNTLIVELETQMGERFDVRRMSRRLFDVPVNVLDIRQAQKILGWRPRLSLQQGISLTIDQLRSEHCANTLAS